jgi:hypothetical protein
MAYEPTVWKDRVVERPLTFNMVNNPDGTVTLVPAPGVIVESGTPVNAVNLNKLEQGLKTHEADIATQPRHGLRIENGNLQYLEDGEWKTTSPVQILEEVVSFDETGITVTHNNTKIVEGSLQLSYSEGTTVSRPNDDGEGSGPTYNGIKITPKKNLLGIKATLSTNTSGAKKAYLKQLDGTNLTNVDISSLSSGDSFEIVYPLSSGVSYYLVTYADGATYNIGQLYSPTFPYTSPDIDIVAGYSSGEVNFVLCSFDKVIALVDATQGTATIEWIEQPTDLKAWDLVTYQNTEDGETVTVDVESSVDGAIWVTEFQNINQNFDVSTIDPAKQVRFKVNLSRVDTNNNPTCDYLARRFIR